MSSIGKRVITIVEGELTVTFQYLYYRSCGWVVEILDESIVEPVRALRSVKMNQVEGLTQRGRAQLQYEIWREQCRLLKAIGDEIES